MNVCVFCGSSKGLNPLYAQAAKELGNLMPKYSMNLVYGGGNVGLMGIVADSVMASGGKVIGIIPDFLLKREVGHRGITELEVVESMHERKKRMADLADAFIALPGGWGTLEELSEVLTWRQLGLIKNPIAILNINNFFDPLLSQMSRMVQDGFVKQENLGLLLTESSPEKLLELLSRL
jgi:uncharacterized protein (TIGR00730 family)